MAATKKIVTPIAEKRMTASVEVSKPEAAKTVAAEVKAEPAKETVVKETVKAAEPENREEAVKKPRGRKPGTASAVKKTAAVRKAPIKKAELTSALHIQYSGKSYSQEDLLKIAKDVWKYDLKQKARELSSIELYVKPEENMVYYVMNKEFTGGFAI